MTTYTIKQIDGTVIVELDGKGKTLAEALTEYTKEKGWLVRLIGADLSMADLSRVDLTGANLSDANLSKSNLSFSTLAKAFLAGANLNGANLIGSDLSGSFLGGADLSGANLVGANLSRAEMFDVNFNGADLSGTCLDPANSPNGQADAFSRNDAGLCIGYRTKQSQNVGSQVYESGKEYIAPWFSTDDTACHPGLYCYPTMDQVVQEYPNEGTVIVTFRAEDCHKAGEKWRVKKFNVL